MVSRATAGSGSARNSRSTFSSAATLAGKKPRGGVGAEGGVAGVAATRKSAGTKRRRSVMESPERRGKHNSVAASPRAG